MPNWDGPGEFFARPAPPPGGHETLCGRAPVVSGPAAQAGLAPRGDGHRLV